MAEAEGASPAIPSMTRQTPPDLSRKIALLFSRCLRSETNRMAAGESGSSASPATITPKTPSLRSPASVISLKSPPSASLPKWVVLEDWWLVKSETSVNGKRLGVGGTTRAGTKAFRDFCSAPIVKRHNTWNLETADGIIVNIVGTVNTSRTYQNGFCQEACCIFMTGFPHDWEIYADGFSGLEDVRGCDPTKAFNDNVFLEKSYFAASYGPLLNLDKIPAAKIFDYVASGCIDSVQECIDFVANNFHVNDDDQVDSIPCDSKEVENFSLQQEGKGQQGKDVECGSECTNEVLQQSSISGKLGVKQELEINSERESLVSPGGMDIGVEFANRYQIRGSTRRSENLKNKENENRTTLNMEFANNIGSDCTNEVLLHSSLNKKLGSKQELKIKSNRESFISPGRMDIGMESVKRITRQSTRRSENLKNKDNEKQTTLDSLKTGMNDGAPVSSISNCSSPVKCDPKGKKSHGRSNSNSSRLKRRRA